MSLLRWPVTPLRLRFRCPKSRCRISAKKNNNGASIADTLSVVLEKIFNTAYDTVLSSKLADLKGAAEESLNSVVDSVKEKSGLKDWFGFGK